MDIIRDIGRKTGIMNPSITIALERVSGVAFPGWNPAYFIDMQVAIITGPSSIGIAEIYAVSGLKTV